MIKRRAMTHDPIRLVYILGSGRCGSTVVGGVLKSDYGFFATGELHWLLPRARNPDERCACGSPVPDCPFWSSVLAECRRRFDLELFDRDSRRFERYPSVLGTLLAKLTRARSLRRYLADLSTLVRVISVVAGTQLVCDSSKNPVRGWLYSLLPKSEVDVRYLHLVRDGRSVLSSWATYPRNPRDLGAPAVPNPKPDPEWFNAAVWASANLLSSLLGRFHTTRYLRVRYEDLVLDPQTTVERIARFLHVAPVSCSPADGTTTPLVFGHMVAGNRIRFQSDVTLGGPTEADGTGRTGLAFSLVGGWLRRIYGYDGESTRRK